MIYVVIAIIVVIGFVYIIVGSKSGKKRKAFINNLFKKTYYFLSDFFLTKKSIQKIVVKISNLAIYRAEEIPEITMKIMLMASLWSAALIFTGLFLFNDIISKILCFVFAFIMYSNVIEKQIDKTFLAVLKEIKRMLSSIEQEYLKSKSIPDALSEADTGKLLRKAIDDIYNIITGSNGELKLQQFYASMPFRPLQTLAGVCYNINIYGDNVDHQNISSFIKALTLLKNDVNAHIEKLVLQKAKFGKMEYLPIAAVFLITPVEMYFTDVIPGVALMYNGLMGFVLRTVTIISAILGYTVISRINRAVSVSEDDRGVWTEKLLNNKYWKNLIISIIPDPKKKKTKQKKNPKLTLEVKLEQAMSKMKPEHYYTKKVAFSAISFIMSLVIIFSACIIGSNFVRNTTAELSLVSSTERTEEQILAMKKMDAVFFEGEGDFTDNDLTILIKRYLPELTDMQLMDEMKRMRDKYNSWKELYFKFFYIWISFVIAIIGYFVPALVLKARAFLVKTEAEDDYMQLQTLVSILIYTGIDTLALLQQMVRHSTVHKDKLLYAYHSYPSAPEREMERLRSKIRLPEFKFFIDKLKLTISELPMVEAFSDLITERESFMRLRYIAMEATLAKKQMIGKILSMTPLILFAASEFVVPIGVLGYMEYSNAMTLFNI